MSPSNSRLDQKDIYIYKLIYIMYMHKYAPITWQYESHPLGLKNLIESTIEMPGPM